MVEPDEKNLCLIRKKCVIFSKNNIRPDLFGKMTKKDLILTVEAWKRHQEKFFVDEDKKFRGGQKYEVAWTMEENSGAKKYIVKEI